MPGHSKNDGVRQGSSVQGKRFFVAGDAHGNTIVMGDWASAGVVTVGYDHSGGDGLQMVVCQGVVGENSIDATALTTTV